MTESLAGMFVMPVLEQHAEDAMVCALRRVLAVDAGHIDLARLARLDELLLAHIDGLRVAGEAGVEVALAGMSAQSDGSAFAPALLAIEREDRERLQRILMLFGAAGRLRTELGPALRWIVFEGRAEPECILGANPTDEQRCLALASFGPRQRDRSAEILDALANPSPSVRAEAAWTAARLGLVALRDRIVHGLDDPDPLHRFRFAASAVLLGHRAAALDVLGEFLLAPGPLRCVAWKVAGPAMELTPATALLKQLAGQSASGRQLIAAVGSVGSTDHVPWLIRQMCEPAVARGAGEAFCTIVGLDLGECGLESAPPEGLTATPDDDPLNEDVDIDPDDGLPWPDPAATTDWWRANQYRFPAGQRLFMGRVPSMTHCLDVLKAGRQRQRAAAALWRVLLHPGTPLFPVEAPVALQGAWLHAYGDTPHRSWS